VHAVWGSELFGWEKNQSFKSSVRTIYQSFGEQDLYPSVEEKAANLLYFVVKNHSFSDGNKRIAAFLFVYFLDRNGCLYHADRARRLADKALVALTLLIAESKPEDKNTMATLVVNLINGKN
jgi:prophage maintenance system killer protein